MVDCYRSHGGEKLLLTGIKPIVIYQSTASPVLNIAREDYKRKFGCVNSAHQMSRIPLFRFWPDRDIRPPPSFGCFSDTSLSPGFMCFDGGIPPIIISLGLTAERDCWWLCRKYKLNRKHFNWIKGVFLPVLND
jgi:hypothetical protein